MKLNPFTLIESLINEHGSSSILKERLSLLKEMLAKVEKERTGLIAKVACLEKELSGLRDQLDKKHVPEEFTEYMGALFKREPSGKYAPVAFCRRCREPLWNNEPAVFPYVCSTPGCGFQIMIHEDLALVAKKLTGYRP
ncbi:MAG: hypothetical protein ACE5FU_07450 [Nitrospinota bacterium]